MKILVTGINGQLGHDVLREGIKRGMDMIGAGREQLDITNKEEVFQYVNRVKPEAIIHCAAYTAVDKAEDDRDNCWNVNVLGTKYIADAAKEVNAKLIYISTDYVFDGKGEQPFVETDEPNPVGYYGLTKYEGEKYVQDLLDESFIVRISWVFGINGNNFIKTMLRLAESRRELNVVADQYGSPTYTLDLSRLIIDMVQTEKYGIYHASNEGYCTWAEFAKKIFEKANRDTMVNTIMTEDYPTRAIRPKNSRLLKRKLVKEDFKPLPEWQDALTRYLNELNQEVK